MLNIKFADNRQVYNWNEDRNGTIPFLSFDMLDKLGVPNLYTTRYISYESDVDSNSSNSENSSIGKGEQGLRVAYMQGEDVDEARSAISVNLGALAEQLGSDLEHVCVTNQKHTANIRLITEDNRNADGEIDGMGYWNSVVKSEPIDGLVTNVPGACLAVYGADCPSIYIVDKTKKAIALVHAGWKGTLGKIPKVAVEMMVKEFGCNPSDMYAAIGPSICVDCYEMGDEVYDAFALEWSSSDADEILHRYPLKANATEDERNRYPDGKYHLDLWKANLMTLERCGIPRAQIEVTNICTCCNADDFYSYRARRMENEQVAMLVNV